MMTRKDYVEVARILNKYNAEIDELIFRDLVDDFAYMFEKDNERFNSEKFWEACNDNKQNNHNACAVNVMGTNYFCDYPRIW